ncbi:MAG TPA: hypothetical protein DDZ41_10780, partial [Flavobacterium sp.]|nr:hypothetical protein [Flavobacterium sp.]
TNKTLWQTDEINAQGQLKKATLGNGITINNTYDSNNFGYLINSKHTLESASIMELSNDFDPLRSN